MKMIKSGLREVDFTKTLGDPDRVFRTFLVCLQEGDYRSALEVLVGGLMHVNKSQFARRYGIPRRTLYNLLDKKSAPSLQLVAKICHALKQESAKL